MSILEQEFITIVDLGGHEDTVEHKKHNRSTDHRTALRTERVHNEGKKLNRN